MENGQIDMSRMKIGYFHGNNLEKMVHKSYSRALTPLALYDYVPTVDVRTAEKIIHLYLNQWRINPKHEIFNISSDESRIKCQEVKNIINNINKISCKKMPVYRQINYNLWYDIRSNKIKLRHVSIKEEEFKEVVKAEINEEVKEEVKAEIKEEVKDSNKIIRNINKEILKRFLKENCKFKKGSYILLEDIREIYSKLLKRNVTRIKNDIFTEVNIAYVVTNEKLCKNCKKIANKRCCDNYNSQNRFNRKIINNISYK